MSKLIALLTFFILHSAAYAAACGGAAGVRHINTDQSLGGFVASTARVDADVYLEKNTQVCGMAQILSVSKNNEIESPVIIGRAKIFDRAIVKGNVLVSDDAQIYGSAIVEALSNNQILIKDKASLYGNSRVFNNARIQGQAKLMGSAVVEKNGRVCSSEVIVGRPNITDEFSHCANPIVKVDISNEQIYTNETINFNATKSKSFAGGALTYIWDFGDEVYIPKKTAVIDWNFKVPKRYIAILTVVDNQGNRDSITKVIKVLPNSNSFPVAFMKPDIFSTRENRLTVNFDGRSSFDKDGHIVNYEWDFGDGVTDSGSKVAHTFNGIGIYRVILKVTDNQGAESRQVIPIEVNCELSDDNTSCSRIVNHDNRIVSVKDQDLAIELASASRFSLSQKINTTQVRLENAEDNTSISIASISRIEDGALKINMNALLTKVKDQREEYIITFNGLKSEDGISHSSTINKIFFASSEIQGKINSRSYVSIESVNRGLKYEIKSTSNGTFNFKNLPFDSYLVTAKYNNITKIDLVLVMPNEVKRHDVNFNEFKRIKVRNNKFYKINDKIENNRSSDSNFEVKELLFTQDSPGVTMASLEQKIPKDQTKFVVAYQLFAVDQVLNDDISIAVFIDNQIVFKETQNILAKMSNLMPKVGDKFASNGWYSREVSLSGIVLNGSSKVRVEISTSAKRRDNISNPDSCGSAIGIDIVFGDLTKPLISQNSLKRTDMNGTNKSLYFPTTVESSMNNNIISTYKLGWDVEFTMNAIIPSDQELVSVGVSVFSQDVEKEVFNFFNIINEVVVAKNNWYQFISKPGQLSNQTTIVLVLPVANIEKAVPWLGSWSEKHQAEKVNFEFFIQTKKRTGLCDGKKYCESTPVELAQVPLYNGKLLKCPLYSTTVDQYMTWSSYRTLKLMVEDEEIKKRMACNDASLPFGGYFDPHSTHQDGIALDVRYFTLSPNANEITTKPQVRIEKIRNAFYSLSAASQLVLWVNDLRAGLKKIEAFNFDLIAAAKKGITSVRFSKGTEFLPKDFYSYIWNQLLIRTGLLPIYLDFTNFQELEGISLPRDCTDTNGACSDANSFKTIFANDHVHLNHTHVEFAK